MLGDHEICTLPRVKRVLLIHILQSTYSRIPDFYSPTGRGANFYIFSVLVFLANLDLNHHEEHTYNLSSPRGGLRFCAWFRLEARHQLADIHRQRA